MAPRFRPVIAESYVSSSFGPRWGTVHRGTDFGLEGGSANMPVFAAQAGVVKYAGAASGFGGPDPAGWLVVDHPAEAGAGTTVYGHIIREVNLGDWVEAGQRIGRVNPNSATNGGVAPHLHFEVHPYVWEQGSQIDPIPWLGNAPSPGEAPATPKDVDGVIFGVDVSEHQNGMPLTKAAAEGMQFAIIRTNDGTHRDLIYRSHVDDARRTDMVLAAYTYLRNPSEGTSIEAQVNTSLEIMGEDHRLPMWLDVETPAGIHVDHIREAKRRFEDAGIRVAGAYSYVPYWENRIAPGEPDSHEFGAFWVAAYGANRHGTPAELYPGNNHRQWTYPLGNQRPSIWQFGSNGAVAGWSVDVNAFRGTRDQLRSLFYGETFPADTPVPEPVPDTVTPAPETPAPAPSEDSEDTGGSTSVRPAPETPTEVPAPSTDPDNRESPAVLCNCPADVCHCRKRLVEAGTTPAPEDSEDPDTYGRHAAPVGNNTADVVVSADPALRGQPGVIWAGGDSEDTETPSAQAWPAVESDDDQPAEDTGYTGTRTRRPWWDLVLDGIVSVIVGRRPR